MNRVQKVLSMLDAKWESYRDELLQMPKEDLISQAGTISTINILYRGLKNFVEIQGDRTPIVLVELIEHEDCLVVLEENYLSSDYGFTLPEVQEYLDEVQEGNIILDI